MTRKIQVKVKGTATIAENFTLKDTLQNIVWVTEVEDRSLGKFIVSYPENTIHLANSLSKKSNLSVDNFSQGSIQLSYVRP